MENHIQQIKKQKLLEILNNIPEEWKKKEGKPLKKTSSYRSVYIRYLRGKKRYPDKLPDFKEIGLPELEKKGTKKLSKRGSFWNISARKKEGISS